MTDATPPAPADGAFADDAAAGGAFAGDAATGGAFTGGAPTGGVPTVGAPVGSAPIDDGTPGPWHDDASAIWHLVDVEDVGLTLPESYPEVVLRERALPRRRLRIPMGLPEGTAIAYAWRGIPPLRPLTHDLLCDLLQRHDVQVLAARVTAFEQGLFHAELDTSSRLGRQVVPCRTSDAVAVVLRQRPAAPLLVAEWVLAAEGELAAD
jgi:bifunctional DNase/RNase